MAIFPRGKLVTTQVLCNSRASISTYMASLRSTHFWACWYEVGSVCIVMEVTNAFYLFDNLWYDSAVLKGEGLPDFVRTLSLFNSFELGSEEAC